MMVHLIPLFLLSSFLLFLQHPSAVYHLLPLAYQPNYTFTY